MHNIYIYYICIYIYIYQITLMDYFQNNVTNNNPSIYPEQLHRFKTNFINMFLT